MMRPETFSDRHLLSSEVARLLHIKRQTLSKWRTQGRGPKGWFYLNPTRCLYPASEVYSYLRSLAETRPAFSLPPPVHRHNVHGAGVTK
jgi:hypothetical protein